MKQEKIREQKVPNFTLIENFLNAADDDLPEELFKPLAEDIDNPRSFILLIRYLKRNVHARLPEAMRALNFDFCTSPKSFDVYNDYRQRVEQLLEEKDGVIDEAKREQARLLLKVIKNTKVFS